MGRAPCCDKANVKKGPWSPEEDQKLRAYIEEHGTGGNWIALPTKIGLKRCGKSCRLRWLNYLRPNIRHGDFSEEEDQIICSLYISIGSRWSIIAAQLPGRTDNDIKNYWNTRLKKKLLGKGGDKPSQPRRLPVNGGSSEESSVDGDDPSSQTINSPALERMQLHMQLQGLYNPLSFYNGPALWPMLQYPLGDSISQGAQTDAIAAAAPQQPSDQDMLVDKHGMINPMLGFSSLRSTATSMENSSSNLSSFDYFGIQGELHDLLYGKNVSVGVQDYEKYMSEFDGNWLGADGFYGISSVGTWDSSSTLQPYAMSQDYVPGHDNV